MTIIQRGQWTIQATPFNAEKTRYTVTHMPTKYVKMDSALPHADALDVLLDTLRWVASRPWADDLKFMTPYQVELETTVSEAAEDALK